MSLPEVKTQDIYKDAGENVQFTIYKFNRKDATAEREAFEEFADKFQAILRSIRIRAAEDDVKATLGISAAGWEYLFPGAKKPAELETFAGLQNAEDSQYAMPAGAAADADLFIHMRANRAAALYEAMSQMRTFLDGFTKVINETKGFRYFEGRAIIGFIDGTENPVEDEAMQWAAIGDEDPEFRGGSYAFAQKWVHDMDFWNGLPTEEQERAVGRRKYSDLELEDDEKSPYAHNSISKAEIDGEEKKIVRMNVPFSDPASGVTGTYFIGYARHWDITRTMLTQMVEKKDYLLSFSKVLFGQLFFIPSRDLLDAIAEGELGE